MSGQQHNLQTGGGDNQLLGILIGIENFFATLLHCTAIMLASVKGVGTDDVVCQQLLLGRCSSPRAAQFDRNIADQFDSSSSL